MENKNKLSGFAKAMIITAVIAVVSLISTICFTVSIGSDAINKFFDNPSEYREALRFGKISDELSELETYQELISKEEKTFTVQSDMLKIEAPLADIKVVLSDTDEIKAVFSQYSYAAGKTSGYTLETDGSTFQIVKNSSDVTKIMPSLILAVPKDKIKAIEIKNKTGDIEVDGISVNMLKIDNSVGDIEVKNVTADSTEIYNKTGDIEADENFKCLNSLKIENKVGDINFALPQDVNFKLSYLTSVGTADIEDVNSLKFNILDSTAVTKASGTVESKNQDGTKASYSLTVQVGDIDLSSQTDF